MNIRIASLSAVATITVGLLSTAPSVADPRADGRVDEISAAQQRQQHKRYAKHTRRSAPTAHAYRPPVSPAPRYGRVADPTFQPNGLPYPRPNYMGACVIDEGYGRWSACSNR